MSRKGSAWRQRMFVMLCERDGSFCRRCGENHRWIWRQAGVWSTPEDGWRYTKVNRSSNLEVDHKHALHIGGDNAPENLWLLCRSCHRDKTSEEQSQRLKRLFAEARA